MPDPLSRYKMFRWDCTVSPILWRGYAVNPKVLKIFNAKSQWRKNGKKYLRINETRQTGAVGNRTYRGGVNAARLETETTAGRKTTPLAPLIRNETRQTGAVGNRTYRGGVNAARLETETTAGRKTTPLAPLIRGES